MAGEDRDKRLEDLRKRLYSRGSTPAPLKRRELKSTKQQVPTSWGSAAPPPQKQQKQTESEPRATVPPVPPVSSQQVSSDDMSPRTSRTSRQYRVKIVAAALGFFAIALVLSTVFLFFGQNTISGSNISIGVTGPFTIGGGEELSLQIAVSNQNAVPVESATLIIEYPPGTQSVDEQGRELFRERQPIPNIESGEVLNIPIRARIFGEENDERAINVSVEYRVAGSNATFFKEADPFRIKISSSPVVLQVENDTEITSGQEVELTINVLSNSPSPVSDVLVTAEYPFGFDYENSSPVPVAGQNTWRIDTLAPEETQQIKVRGVVFGNQNEERVFRFSVGVPNERDAFSLASVFSTASTEMTVTEAFLSVDVSINGDDNPTVAVGSTDRARVILTFYNTLSSTLYDGEIEVKLGGNALDDNRVDSRPGFYDSNSNTIVWTTSQLRDLSEILPGESRTVSFTVEQGEGLDASRTPQITLDVSLRGKRVSESRVPEELTDTVSRTIRFESVIGMTSQAVYSTGPFFNTGPTPPVAEEVTQYTVVLEARNGSNAVTDAEITATLPTYITWLDLVSAGDTINYNPVARQITWDIGDLNAGEAEGAAFQVSFLPSISQVGSVPTILSTQYLRATDRFTGTVLRAEAPALTTRLVADPELSNQDGRVQDKND